jgi:uncharacterized membrane protein
VNPRTWVAGCLAVVTVCVAACAKGEPGRGDSAGAIANNSAAKSGSPLLSALPLRALGTEPFWALDIETNGLRLITPDDTVGIRFPSSAPTIVGDTTVWTGRNEQSAIEVRIWMAKCSDGMSDREYPHSVRVLLGETIYRGCADRRAVIVPP